MQLSLQPSPKPIDLIPERKRDAAFPVLLEFQSPSAAIVAAPVPRSARGTIWIVTSLFFACLVPMGLIPIDRVVTAQGKVLSQSATIVVQPLETAIVRSIGVREGQTVHAGDILARLDPTFATADVGALQNQVASLQAEVSRLQAEANGKPFAYTGTDAAMTLQAAIFAQRQAERDFRLENYKQKISGLVATVSRNQADAAAYKERLGVALDVEKMRKQLEKLQVGSHLNSLAATDSRLEMTRGLQNAVEQSESAKRDLTALVAERDAYLQNWRAETSQKLSEQTRALSDARENLMKAQLRQHLVELRAEQDATVLTVAKVSVGSVLQSGEQLITLVPNDAPLEIEANIAGRDDGFVRVGDSVAIKFDTFPYHQYGMAQGTVRTVSADSFTSADEARSRTGATGAVPVPQGSTEPFFRARITIDKTDLHDVPANFHLAPGMPVTADIKVGKRTVLSYLLGRVLPVASEGMREP
ncbi:MAG: HlyD family type I secretion periplasmic adaptor subunit [Acetobacteraceae bacterium]|nr:HlyD family type I secretion periplasmic adaptor subunit [Acetobacteraceae bacterium]